MPGTVTPGSSGASQHGSSTVAQSPVAGRPPTIFSKAALAIKRTFVSVTDIAKDDGSVDASRLWRALHVFEENVVSALRPVFELPWVQGSNSFTGLNFTAGQTSSIPHKLGRNWRGWQTTNASGSAPQLIAVANPTGSTNAQFLTLQHTGGSATTFDLLIF